MKDHTTTPPAPPSDATPSAGRIRHPMTVAVAVRRIGLTLDLLQQSQGDEACKRAIDAVKAIRGLA